MKKKTNKRLREWKFLVFRCKKRGENNKTERKVITIEALS
jgi:hypothetical protein